MSTPPAGTGNALASSKDIHSVRLGVNEQHRGWNVMSTTRSAVANIARNVWHLRDAHEYTT